MGTPSGGESGSRPQIESATISLGGSSGPENTTHRKCIAVYECIFCGETFSDRDELDGHLSSHVTQPGSETGQNEVTVRSQERALRCPICHHFTAWSETELQQHLDTHVLGYKCVFCAFTTLKRTRLRSHLPQHAFERNFKCQLCGMGFYKKELLNRHLKTHGPKNFACNQCDHTTYSQRMLNDHLAIKHSSEKVHKCKECNELFRHSADLSVHRRKVHKIESTKYGKSDIKRCPDCPFETKRRPEFILHRYEVHELFPIIRQDPLQLQCGVEGCTFSVDSELKFVTHIQAKHRTEMASSSNVDLDRKCLSCRLCPQSESCTHTSSGRSRGSKCLKKTATSASVVRSKDSKGCLVIVRSESASCANKESSKETAILHQKTSKQKMASARSIAPQWQRPQPIQQEIVTFDSNRLEAEGNNNGQSDVSREAPS